MTKMKREKKRDQGRKGLSKTVMEAGKWRWSSWRGASKGGELQVEGAQVREKEEALPEIGFILKYLV